MTKQGVPDGKVSTNRPTGGFSVPYYVHSQGETPNEHHRRQALLLQG